MAIRVGCAVMVERAGKLLLGIRGKDPGRGSLIIPGGGVGELESLADTARREMREEVGLEITNLRQFGTYEIINAEKGEHRVIIYWRAESVSGDVVPSPELLDAKFYSKSEIAMALAEGKFQGGITEQVLRDSGWI
ncbi:MAG: NUDIX hydrolase [Alphaproteobacteria bacterium]|nr:NUDIX hydrolase [Alphaproteobacteria bacterium]